MKGNMSRLIIVPHKQ